MSSTLYAWDAVFQANWNGKVTLLAALDRVGVPDDVSARLFGGWITAAECRDVAELLRGFTPAQARAVEDDVDDYFARQDVRWLEPRRTIGERVDECRLYVQDFAAFCEHAAQHDGLAELEIYCADEIAAGEEQQELWTRLSFEGAGEVGS